MRIPLLGICGNLQDASTITRAGADFVEASVQGFLIPREDETRFAAHLEAASKLDLPILDANLFLPADLPCVGPAVDEAVLLAYADTALARAARAGLRHVVFGSGGARQIPDGFPRARAGEQFVEFLKKIAPLAERAGVTLVIEPLNAGDCNFINTLYQGADFVEACGHPHVALLADTFHMGFSGEGPDTLREFARHLRHVHVAEYPSRRFPGADGQSYRACFEALRETDYQGDISVECRWENLAADAGTALANLRRDLAAAGYPVATASA